MGYHRYRRDRQTVLPTDASEGVMGTLLDEVIRLLLNIVPIALFGYVVWRLLKYKRYRNTLSRSHPERAYSIIFDYYLSREFVIVYLAISLVAIVAVLFLFSNITADDLGRHDIAREAALQE